MLKVRFSPGSDGDGPRTSAVADGVLSVGFP